MKKKIFTLIALTICTCSMFTACQKKNETSSVSEAGSSVVTNESVPSSGVKESPDVSVTNNNFSGASATAAEVSESDITGVNTDKMTNDEKEFYGILLRVAEESFYLNDAFSQGASLEEIYGGESEEDFIRMVSEEAGGQIKNAERKESAIKVFEKHFHELGENFDYEHSCYPDWKTLYDEYSGNGFTTSVSDNSSFESAFESLSLTDNMICSYDGVDFTVEDIKGDSGAASLKLNLANNNPNNKKARIMVWDVYVNGLSVGSQWDSNEVLNGDAFSAPCEISYYPVLLNAWNDYGKDLSEAPIETIGFYYSIQIGSDSDFEYNYTELKTSDYSTGSALYGTLVGSIEGTIPNEDYSAEIPVTTNVYRYEAVDGIIIAAINSYPNDGIELFVGNKRISGNSVKCERNNYIKLVDEETLRREYEIGPDEPLNLRLETSFGSVTVIE